MTGEPSLRIAVVGHTNTGKTSLLQTLLRRRDFGVVSPRGGTTRASLAGEVADSEGPIATILDTPGLEDSLELRERLEAGRVDRHEDPRTLLDRLLDSPAAASDGPLGLEADAI
ncbi:MAG: GTPase domain-containing protein, partial [Planctomycetota bacterium]|nr:GTPase domain-containing protein [Planctomycetota bacterium]